MPVPIAVSLLGPAVMLLSVCVAVLALHLNRRHERRKVLTDRLDAFLTSDRREQIAALEASSPSEIVVDSEKRERSIDLLLGLQRIAGSVSQRATDWDVALDHRLHEQLRVAVDHSATLVQVIQCSPFDVGTRAWNGHRRHAFRSVLRAFRIRLRLPR